MGLSARANHYIIGNDIMMGFSFVVVALRFYARIKHSQRKLWWDDLFILFSLALAVAFGTTVNVSVGHYGWDRHIWDIPLDDLSGTKKTYLLAKELFILASTCIRQSLLLFYLWLIRDQGRSTLRCIIYGCLVANIALCLTFCLVNLFACRPVYAIWNYPRPEGSTCLDDGTVTSILGGFLCLADFVVNLLPLAIVAKLKVPLHQRASIAALLSLGAVATIAGIVREFWIWKALIDSNDPTYQGLPLWICADVEIYVALLCACAPAIKPLLWSLHQQRPLTAFMRRRHSYARLSQFEPVRDMKPHPHKDIFDGACRTHVTQIYATHLSSDTGHPTTGRNVSMNDTIMSAPMVENGSGWIGRHLSGIQVVTEIRLERTEITRGSIDTDVSSRDDARTEDSRSPV